MRKAQAERPRHGATHGETRSTTGQGPLDPASWIGLSTAGWTEGLKWMEFWQREMQRMWGIGPTMFALRGPRRDGDMRRASDLPWLPRLEAQVIPLRRNTDPPGGEATRFSVRLPLPWSGAGANVVALEAIVGGDPALSPGATEGSARDAGGNEAGDQPRK